jgi:flagellar motor component MotA
MKDTDKAFPVLVTKYGYDGEVLGVECFDPGMTLKQYAAIHLKVPRSGDPEIDAMIRESVRKDFMERGMEGILVTKEEVERVREFADAMLAEWEKEAEK